MRLYHVGRDGRRLTTARWSGWTPGLPTQRDGMSAANARWEASGWAPDGSGRTPTHRHVSNSVDAMPDPLYVPVLKGRQDEFAALADVQPATRNRILPLVEILPGPDDDAATLRQAPQVDLLLDVGEVNSDLAVHAGPRLQTRFRDLVRTHRLGTCARRPAIDRRPAGKFMALQAGQGDRQARRETRSRCAPAEAARGPTLPGGLSLLRDSLCEGRKRCPDIGREIEKVLIAWQSLQALVHQPAGAVDIAAPMRQPRLQVGQLRPTECRMFGHPVEPVCSVIVGEPVE